MNPEYDSQLIRMRSGRGFIAALDQSGGSTPKALAAYGVSESSWSSEAEMFDAVHAMRSRIMTSPAFTGGRVLGAILFENTMDRKVDDAPTAAHLWTHGIVPFVKVDVGLADRTGGVQLMRDNPGLAELLGRAVDHRVFGTKMRSVIHAADEPGINDLIAQQFHVGRQILAAGLMPILEPEVNIEAPDKAEAEVMVLAAIRRELAGLGAEQVMFKLSLPEAPNHYELLVSHPNVLRVVALSGGYALHESCARLAANHGIIASFSRVLINGLSVDQDQAGFDAALDATIQQIFEASTK